MGFIRPEVRDLLWRGREILTGIGVVVLGLWAGLGSFGLLAILGWSAVVIGTVMVLLGVQRLRFRRSSDGPGVVQITEAQIAYFGPLDGGVVGIDGLRRVVLDPRSHPTTWVLYPDSGAPLHIPVTAKGAETLFDVLEQLPGLQTERMLRRMENPGDLPQEIWKRSLPRLG